MSCSRLFCQGNLNESEESLNVDVNKTLFFRLIDVDNFLLVETSNLVEITDLSFEDLGNPNGSFDDSVSGTEDHEGFLFVEE